jgi:hypothetical protein
VDHAQKVEAPVTDDTRDPQRPVSPRVKLALAAMVLMAIILAILYVRPMFRTHLEIEQLMGTWSNNGVMLIVEQGEMTLIQPNGDGLPPRETRMLVRYITDTTPKRFITVPADAPGNPFDRPDLACPGIFELAGDHLRLAIGLPGAGFPADFDAEDAIHMELQRQTK